MAGLLHYKHRCNMQMGLQSKLLLPTILSIVASMALAGLFSYRKASDELWKELIASSQHIADTVCKGLSIYTEDIKNVLVMQSRSESITETTAQFFEVPEFRLSGLFRG